MKSKEESMKVLESDLCSEQQRCVSLKEHLLSLQSDNEELSLRNQTLSEECAELQAYSTTTAPKLAVMEPEVQSLRVDVQQLDHENKELRREVVKLRSIDEAVSELKDNLQQAMSADLKKYGGKGSGPSKGYNNTMFHGVDMTVSDDGSDEHSEPSDGNNANGGYTHRHSIPSGTSHLSASQMHGSWTSLPSIQALCPALHFSIHRLYEDMRMLEIEKDGLVEDKLKQSKLLENMQQEQMLNSSRRVPIEQEMTDVINQYRRQVADSEEQAMKNMSARVTVEQIRTIFKSAVGGMLVCYRCCRWSLCLCSHAYI